MHIDVGFLTKYQLIKMHIGVELRPKYQFDLYINLRVAVCVPDFLGVGGGGVWGGVLVLI